MGNEKATRIQTSLLNGVEKKALVWIAKRLPVWATSNMLTAVGTFGAVLCAVGFGLANIQLILEKYHGEHTMFYENGWFQFTADIPLTPVS